jgi:hypothetical protein
VNKHLEYYGQQKHDGHLPCYRAPFSRNRTPPNFVDFIGNSNQKDSNIRVNVHTMSILYMNEKWCASICWIGWVMDVTDVGYVQSSALCGLWLEIALGHAKASWLLAIVNNNQQPPLIGDCCSTIWITLPLHHNTLALLSPLPIYPTTTTSNQQPAFYAPPKQKRKNKRESIKRARWQFIVSWDISYNWRDGF